MNVFNIHERALDATPEQVGALPDSPDLARGTGCEPGTPGRAWPHMAYDRQARSAPTAAWPDPVYCRGVHAWQVDPP